MEYFGLFRLVRAICVTSQAVNGKSMVSANISHAGKTEEWGF
jgi:hypothetical protein